MFGSAQRKLKILFGLSDVCLVAASFAVAYTFRRVLHLDREFYFSSERLAMLLSFSAAVWVAGGYWLDVYGKVDAGDIRAIIADSFRQSVYQALALVLLEFSLRLDISRLFLSSFVALNWFFLLTFRVLARNLIPVVRRRFGAQRYVLIVGRSQRAQRLLKNLEGYFDQGLRVFGFLDIPEETGKAVAEGSAYPVFPLGELAALLRRHVIDEVHFAVESDLLASLEDVMLACDDEGVRTRIAADFFPHVNSRMALDRVGETPMLTFSATPDDDLLLTVKRAIDVVLALFALIVLSPVLLAVAILVKLTSPGPVIFRQTRCGLNGRNFTFYKFRSMVADAEDRMAEVAHLNQKSVVTKIPNDPRLTPVGRFLRRFSLDELPQLVNVLRGDMSLVGPRPAIPSEVAQYQRWQRRRLRMRPGLTCLWAVRGRDALDFETWMRLDMSYIDNWSLALDARILLRTIPQVMSGKAN